MTTKVFIDGEHGTTGLQIQKRLAERQDLQVLSIPHTERHDVAARIDRLKAADIVILCLPDTAALEAVKLLDGNHTTRIIDSSTAHRISHEWVYGFAEMTAEQEKRIRAARFVSNPGCYPTGAIGILRPLREASLVDPDIAISINAVSGYTGGGKQLIAQMEDANRDDAIASNYFVYGLNLKHKHVPEIKTHGQLTGTPLFIPSVGRFAQGMVVNIPLHASQFRKSVKTDNLRDILAEHYKDKKFVSVASKEETESTVRLDPEMLANTDDMKIFVFGDDNNGIFNISAVLDNLGKGASGAAVQNLDLMMENV